MNISKTISAIFVGLSTIIISQGLTHGGKTESFEEIQYYIAIDNPPSFISEYDLKSPPFFDNEAERASSSSIPVKGYIEYKNNKVKLTLIKEIVEYTKMNKDESGKSHCENVYGQVKIINNRIIDKAGSRRQEISFLQYRDAFGDCEGPLIFEFAADGQKIAVEAYFRRRPFLEKKGKKEQPGLTVEQ